MTFQNETNNKRLEKKKTSMEADKMINSGKREPWFLSKVLVNWLRAGGTFKRWRKMARWR